MGVVTKIAWCDHTWNPWRGCSHASEGCEHCYAERGSLRNPTILGRWGDLAARAIAAAPYWRLPYRWNEEASAAGMRRRVFALSLGDWLELRPDLVHARAAMLRTIFETPYLDWLLLTKRPQHFREALVRSLASPALSGAARRAVNEWLDGVPPLNVWAGASAENQVRAVERYHHLAAIPASIRFFSCEPLLGAINLFDLGRCGYYCDPSIGHVDHHLPGVHWVIAGGESGPAARACRIDWIQDLVDQCRAMALSVFVKQLGSNVEANDLIDAMDHFPGDVRLDWGSARPWARVHLRHPKGEDPAEWPPRLAVRQFPH